VSCKQNELESCRREVRCNSCRPRQPQCEDEKGEKMMRRTFTNLPTRKACAPHRLPRPKETTLWVFKSARRFFVDLYLRCFVWLRCTSGSLHHETMRLSWLMGSASRNRVQIEYGLGPELSVSQNQFLVCRVGRWLLAAASRLLSVQRALVSCSSSERPVFSRLDCGGEDIPE
jgi:hypothetical protein